MIKLFVSKTSFLKDDAASRINQLEELGVPSPLSDDDVELVPIKIPYDKIVYSYPLGEGFKVGVISADSFWCLDDPFADPKGKDDPSNYIVIVNHSQDE